MGCTTSHQELISKTFREFEENELTQSNEIITKLPKGGLIIRTSLGNIQYGIPPESVKDSLGLKIEVPEYYIIPKQRFNFDDGISLIEIEFPIYYNFFFKKKKTKFICNQKIKNKIITIFRETLLGPMNFDNFKDDFVENYQAIPFIEKELAHFAVNPFKPSQKLNLDLFLDFIIYDDFNEAIIQSQNQEKENKIEIKIETKKSGYVIYENNQFLTSFKNNLEIVRNEYNIYNTLSQSQIKFEPPFFGVTALGSSHGFDACGSTSGFIIWINSKGIMVDPPPFTTNILKHEGIPPNLIDKIILTHCHADHDAGAFHKIIESSPIEFISTKTVINSFLRKCSAQCDMKISSLKKLFDYRFIKIGHSYNILGAKFDFFYSFHSIPCICFQVEFQNKRFYLSGDTFFNKEKLKELYDQNLFNQARYEQLTS